MPSPIENLDRFAHRFAEAWFVDYPVGRDGPAKQRASSDAWTDHCRNSVRLAATGLGFEFRAECRGFTQNPQLPLDGALFTDGQMVAPFEWDRHRVVTRGVGRVYRLNSRINEIAKLREACSRAVPHGFAGYIGYVPVESTSEAIDVLQREWAGVTLPLLAVLIGFLMAPVRGYRDGKRVRVWSMMTFHEVTGGAQPGLLHRQHALPWLNEYFTRLSQAGWLVDESARTSDDDVRWLVRCKNAGQEIHGQGDRQGDAWIRAVELAGLQGTQPRPPT